MNHVLTWNQQMAGVKALLGITNGELECILPKMLDVYIDEVESVYQAILKEQQ